MNSPQAELWLTDHETGKDHLIEWGDLLMLTQKVYDLVSKGKDAWTKAIRPHPLSPIKEGGVRLTPIYDCVVKDGGLLCAQHTVRTLEKELTYFKGYVIPEKDKHGKYWHDLAQERCARNAQLQADNAKLRCDGYASDSLIDMIVAHAGISTKYSDKYGRGEAISEVINHIDDLRARNVGTDFIIEKQRQVILACADPKGGFLSTGPEQVIAYQASLRTQLKDMTDQFFAVSQQDAKRLDALHRMRGDSSWEESEQFLKDVWNRNDGTDLRGSLDIELKRLEAESVSPPDAALQSSRAAEEGK